MGTTVMQEIEEHLGKTDRATQRARAMGWATNWCRNLEHLHEPVAATFPVSHKGMEAIVVCGAGPSLVDAIPAIMRCGAPVIAVNTAAPALLKAGIDPLVTVCIDSAALHTKLTDIPRLVVHWACDPSTFDLARRGGGWLAQHGPQLSPYCMPLEVPPLRAGGTALCAATALASRWGARKIWLAGVDLAWSEGEGAAYADGSGWGGLRSIVDPETKRVRFVGREERDAMHEQAGLPPPARDRQAFRVPAANGGETWSSIEMISQAVWLEGWAAVHGKVRELVRIGDTGIRLEGFRTATTGELRRLRQGYQKLQTPPGLPRVPAPLVRNMVREMRGKLRIAQETAERIIEHGFTRTTDPCALESALGVIQVMAASDILTLNDEHPEMEPAARLRAIYTIWAAACEHALECTKWAGDA